MKIQRPVSLRFVATLLMVAGAAGFVVSLLFLDGQDSFLFGSTLVTFMGLGLYYGVRRFGWARGSVRNRAAAPQARSDELQAMAGADRLLDRVLAVAARDGARVKVEASQEDRDLLRVTARDGMLYTAIVTADPRPVDVAGVRALYALINQSQSAGGYLISAGRFTPQAYSWANGRRIRLVRMDEMDQLGF